MPKYASGKHALAISDRSGLQFPWREMVTEWTGAFVHVSEYEPKQPQLRPKTLSADSISLSKVRPARTAFPTRQLFYLIILLLLNCRELLLQLLNPVIIFQVEMP